MQAEGQNKQCIICQPHLRDKETIDILTDLSDILLKGYKQQNIIFPAVGEVNSYFQLLLRKIFRIKIEKRKKKKYQVEKDQVQKDQVEKQKDNNRKQEEQSNQEKKYNNDQSICKHLGLKDQFFSIWKYQDLEKACKHYLWKKCKMDYLITTVNLVVKNYLYPKQFSDQEEPVIAKKPILRKSSEEKQEKKWARKLKRKNQTKQQYLERIKDEEKQLYDLGRARTTRLSSKKKRQKRQKQQNQNKSKKKKVIIVSGMPGRDAQQERNQGSIKLQGNQNHHSFENFADVMLFPDCPDPLPNDFSYRPQPYHMPPPPYPTNQMVPPYPMPPPYPMRPNQMMPPYHHIPPYHMPPPPYPMRPNQMRSDQIRSNQIPNQIISPYPMPPPYHHIPSPYPMRPNQMMPNQMIPNQMIPNQMMPHYPMMPPYAMPSPHLMMQYDPRMHYNQMMPYPPNINMENSPPPQQPHINEYSNIENLLSRSNQHLEQLSDHLSQNNSGQVAQNNREDNQNNINQQNALGDRRKDQHEKKWPDNNNQ